MALKQTSDFAHSLSEATPLQQLQHHKQQILQNSLKKFRHETSTTLKVGIELEFYILQPDQSQIQNAEIYQNFIAALQAKLGSNPLVYAVEKEQGVGQIEIKFLFTADLIKLCTTVEEAIHIAQTLAKSHNLIACFAAQQFHNDCGNALQFNISPHDENDVNLFSQNQQLVEKYAAALLEKTNEMLILLAPKPEDYLRFCLKTNQNLFKKGKYSAPVNLSFGNDNRTCAIRIPHKSQRLEYRVACSNADPFLAISAVLCSLILGFESEKTYPKIYGKIYGNAFEEQYQLTAITNNIDKSYADFLSSDLHQQLQKML